MFSPQFYHCFCDSDFELGRGRLQIINGAARDAKLFEQAKTALVEAGRGDLLVRRMVRMHWEADTLSSQARLPQEVQGGPGAAGHGGC